mmetsp:Transcript_76642/g.224979  ORF Transcript_76642/g.224979 Transcript_76642/m.224979 type:complete len:149 (-) Transcript_76642:178-624(-)
MEARPRPSRAPSRSRSPRQRQGSAGQGSVPRPIGAKDPPRPSSAPGRAPSREDATEARPRLQRHQGAERDTRPAWMTRGCGVNEEFFGETRGDLVKPGMTQADLERLEKKVRSDSPDPLGDFFHGHADAPPRSRRAPLPDQDSLFSAA